MSSPHCTVRESSGSPAGPWAAAPARRAFGAGFLRSLAIGALVSPLLTLAVSAQEKPESVPEAPAPSTEEAPPARWVMKVRVKLREKGETDYVVAETVVVRREGSDKPSNTGNSGVAVVTGTGEGEVSLQVVAPGVPVCPIKIPGPRAAVTVLIDKSQKGSCKLEE
jgi:hypothetical protein